MDDIETLEEQLRSLPRTAVPQGLLERLLADIPESRDLVSPQRLRNWKLPFAAVAAALFVSAAVSVYFHRSSTGNRERSVAAEYVLYHPIHKQETDPCFILPPFPDSSRL